MKCWNHHQTDAVATCVFCGIAICSSCIAKSTTGRVICSPACGKGISSTEAALDSIRQKLVGGNRLLVYFLFGVGFLFGAFALFETARALSSGMWHLALFLGGSAVVFIGIGTAFSRMGSRKE